MIPVPPSSSALKPSAHVDTFCRDNLPPPAEWPELVFDLPELSYRDRLNAVTALIDGAVARWGVDRPCVLSRTEVWSYGELLGRANRIAHVLVGRGVVPGNRVLLRGTNSPWLAACRLGVLKAGAVAVATMPMLRAHELTKIVEVSRPSLALCEHGLVTGLRGLRGLGPVRTYGAPGPQDLGAFAAGQPGGFTDVDNGVGGGGAAGRCGREIP